MPFMEIIMPVMMAKMMPMMLTEDNQERMERFPERMLPKMLANEQVRELMPGMMCRMMPHCLVQILPYLAEEKKADFVARMKDVLEDGSGDPPLTSPLPN